MQLFLQALLEIIRFEYFVSRRDFASIHRRVRASVPSPTPTATVDRISTAVDLACAWYPKSVLCLQRSAATTCLMRRHGIAASLTIGVRQMPFRAHAWVEVAGVVVNDKTYVPQIYAVLERC